MADTLPVNSTPLYPLANAKGTDLLCELCQKPAFIQCSQCRVTYYCGVEHQRADWLGIHAKICEQIAELRKPLPFLTSEKDRKEKQEETVQKQMQLIDSTRTTGQRLLFENRFDEAVPAALQSLKFAIEVYGGSSVELVPSYLILGEASIGLSRLSQAEEYLSQAQWTVLKTEDASNKVKSQLHRNLGLLFSAKEEYNRALENLAIDVYHASDEFGPDDIRVSGGYFNMANIFLGKSRFEVAFDLYGRVVDIWYDHLWRIMEIITAPPDIPDGIGEVVAEITHEEKEHLDEAQQAEAMKILHSIYELLSEQLPDSQKELADWNARLLYLARTAQCLLMLYFVMSDRDRAEQFANSTAAHCAEAGADADEVAAQCQHVRAALT